MKIRKDQPELKLDREEFVERYLENFYDPRFESAIEDLKPLAEIAWENYRDGRKAPRTKPAGKGYADPKYALSDQWRESARRVQAAQAAQRRAGGKPNLLVISASPRNRNTCPGESPKSYRLAEDVRAYFAKRGAEIDLLDLSEITAEYGKNIHPCKSCVSTAMPLCHWPCSCYPNNSLAQTQDWMADIYVKWARAHGIMIITPVHWYQAPSALKLMMDRLVCADGGNPDPSSTHGKDVKLAKKLELKGWPYPKHLAGRIFSVVVHGDVTGAEGVRRALFDWLCDMELLPAPPAGHVDGYVGYMKPYATSHEELDRDTHFAKSTMNAAKVLLESVSLMRRGEWPARAIEAGVEDPVKK